MTRFLCGRCGATLSDALTEVPMPAFEVDDSGGEEPAPLLERGTYAVDPAPFGPPSVPVTTELARAHGIPESRFREWQAGRGPSPVVYISDGPRGTFVVNPADTRGLQKHSDPRRLYGCCNLAGSDGPNLTCSRCGAEVATLQNDCWVGRTTLRFAPGAVCTTED